MKPIDLGWEEYLRECDARFNHKAFWYKTFAFLPHRCDITKKLIWLQFGYEGIRYTFSPADDIAEVRWHSSKAHTFWMLTK
jgi:hypothetical protein